MSTSLGAMCHWALLSGARKAVAVETQPDFCARARAMLRMAEGMWPPLVGASETQRFDVVQMGVREFLAGCSDHSFDIVVGAGLLHCFSDPVKITLEMCRVARVAVVLEVDHPEVYLNGVLSDGDHDCPAPAGGAPRANRASLARGAAPPPHTSEDAGLLQLAPSAMVNKAGNDDSSYTGLAVVPSRALLERLVGAFGFEPIRVRMTPHPTLNLDVHTYTQRRLHAAVPRRFFLRCIRPTAALEAARARAPVGSLEDAVVSGKGQVHSWHDAPHARDWWTFRAADVPNDDPDAFNAQQAEAARVLSGFGSIPSESGIPVASTTHALGYQTSCNDDSLSAASTGRFVGNWSFDRDVAKRFDCEAFCHIPDYDDVIAASIEAIERTWVPSALSLAGVKDGAGCERAKQTYGVIDVGCATGRTMIALLRKGFAHVFGVDASVSMLEACREKLTAAGYPEAAKDCLAYDATFPPSSFFSPKKAGQGQGISGGAEGQVSLGAVIANWTLHFIADPSDRAAYLGAIYDALVPGGCLVLTEKTRQDAATRSIYHAWKMHPRGVSAQKVLEKSESLVGILKPLPVHWWVSFSYI